MVGTHPVDGLRFSPGQRRYAAIETDRRSEIHENFPLPAAGPDVMTYMYDGVYDGDG